MGAEKRYTSPDFYEKKLARVMERFGVAPDKFDWDFNRKEAWISFWYKGNFYRFEHSVAKAREHGENLNYGSDVFAQLVLALEDLARLVDRGIYELSTWVKGLRALPPKASVKPFCIVLGLDHNPVSEAEIKQAYHDMARVSHPDIPGSGGSAEKMNALQQARDEAIKWFKEQNR